MPHDAALTLSFDTSGPRCAAALTVGPTLLGQAREDLSKGQAERLLPMLAEVLQGAGKSWADLDAIAVCTGPGNFTGTRIAVSAARGLALALGKPAIGVSTFEALAFATTGPALVVLDAKQDRLAVQLFQDGAAVDTPQQTTLAALRTRKLPGDAQVLGHNATTIAGLIGARAGTEDVAVNPANLGRIAQTRLSEAVARPAPIYLRGADAAISTEPPVRILDRATR